MPPPIGETPRPPENPDERTQTGEFRAVVEPMLRAHDNKMTLRGIITAVGAVAASVVAALIFIDNRVAAQTDAGMAVQAAELKAVDTRVTTLEKRFDRFDAKMDALLDAAHVPQSARPAPVDGGK